MLWADRALKAADVLHWLQEAIDLYRGDFLADFYLPDSSEPKPGE